MRHVGETAVHDRVGIRLRPWGSAQVSSDIPSIALKFLGQQRMSIISARDDNGHMWVTPLTGPAGFLRSTDGTVIEANALPTHGDPLAGAFDTRREVGMLVIDLTTRRRMRINGSALAGSDSLVVYPDQVYANCPKYIQSREPFDVPTHARSNAISARNLTDAQRALIESADTFFLGTQADPYGADASHRGGNPGFVSVSSPNHLSWPEYAGNLMYMTLGNLELEPKAGLLFIDWTSGAHLHLTGRAYTDWDPHRASDAPGGIHTVDFEIGRALQIDGAHSLGWTLREYSKFNPE